MSSLLGIHLAYTKNHNTYVKAVGKALKLVWAPAIVGLLNGIRHDLGK